MPTYRLSPADLARLPADTRRVVAQALADHLGAPVAVGDAEAVPPAEEEPVPQAAPAPRLWPWVRGVGIAVLLTGGVVAGSVAWLLRPQAGIPAGSLDLPPATAKNATDPAATTRAAPQKAQAPGDPVHATAPAGGGKTVAPTVSTAQSGAHATAPAQVLPNPPAPGATICKLVGGVYACGWVQAG